jgi:hypothetical protein
MIQLHLSYPGWGYWRKIKPWPGGQCLVSCRGVEQLPELLVLCPQLFHFRQLALVVLLERPLLSRHRADRGKKKTTQSNSLLLGVRLAAAGENEQGRQAGDNQPLGSASHDNLEP